jgi:cytochrome c
VALVVTTGLCMGYGRHLYRENAVDEHRTAMAAATDDFELASAAVHWRQLAGIGLVKLPPGQKRYEETCSGCHLPDQGGAGPSLKEIYELYGQDPNGVDKMVAWAKKPGRKRTNMIAMPAFGYLPESELRATSEYMLELAVAPVSENGTSESETLPAGDTPPVTNPGDRDTDASSDTPPVKLTR